MPSPKLNYEEQISIMRVLDESEYKIIERNVHNFRMKMLCSVKLTITNLKKKILLSNNHYYYHYFYIE
jgi:hypothetical protein